MGCFFLFVCLFVFVVVVVVVFHNRDFMRTLMILLWQQEVEELSVVWLLPIISLAQN